MLSIILIFCIIFDTVALAVDSCPWSCWWSWLIIDFEVEVVDVLIRWLPWILLVCLNWWFLWSFARWSDLVFISRCWELWCPLVDFFVMLLRSCCYSAVFHFPFCFNQVSVWVIPFVLGFLLIFVRCFDKYFCCCLKSSGFIWVVEVMLLFFEFQRWFGPIAESYRHIYCSITWVKLGCCCICCIQLGERIAFHWMFRAGEWDCEWLSWVSIFRRWVPVWFFRRFWEFFLDLPLLPRFLQVNLS